ncbi:hypothetical protein COLO4_36326 [Corchorus olitorius]|uniref:Uncharacterized protein n=1 Tax=Corchorus olitorius TaxID=93759 RepID=A0A1R3G9X4_9ROSI|nr:hypothetical protein COLO4_36326 [Corchorus olitorius]
MWEWRQGPRRIRVIEGSNDARTSTKGWARFCERRV